MPFRLLYAALLYALLPFLFLRLAWRGRKAADYGRRWGERLGFVPKLKIPELAWIHAVSFGEVQAAAPLVRALLRQQKRLLITTMTPTGSAQVNKLFGDQVAHCYLPYDTPDAVARFLSRTNPVQGILLETELWPNLIHACARRNIPLYLVNARLSERSARGYQRIAPLIRPALARLTRIAAQTDADAERLRALGAQRVTTVGSMKFDLAVPDGLRDQSQATRAAWGNRPVWIAASTHAGEDELVLAAHQTLRAEFPDLLLILVPRHPERFDGVAEWVAGQDAKLARRSLGAFPAQDIDVYLGDTMGELLLLYGCAEVAFVGGSLVPTGGHNPLEPAALGVPVVVGPHTFNFADITQHLLAREACRQIPTPEPLAATVATWLRDSTARQTAGQQGKTFVAENRGATARVMAMIESYEK